MKKVSYGIIPLREVGNQRQLLLVKHKAGHWALPKGHPEEGESPKQTALRELKEETNLSIKAFLECEPLVEHYSFMHKGEHVEKTVIYYIALVNGDLLLQEEEIAEAQWFTFDQAYKMATFDECKNLIKSLFHPDKE